MLKRTTLGSREDCLVKVELLCSFLVCQDQSTSRSTQSFVSRGRHNICIRDRARMLSCCNKTSDMSHIYHEVSANLICNLAETLEINRSRISTCTCNDQLRLCLHCDLFELVIVDKSVVIYSVRNNVEIQTGEVDWASVSQMTTITQVHTHNRVAWF